MSKFRFPIFPDRTYTIKYEDFDYEITGEEIIASFRRGAYLEQIIQDMQTEALGEGTVPDTHDSSE
jgi:hypothetical protein